ncbi:hypothetical protein Q5424_25655 [Conexibacter sp. JD483]|uniref:hypothetical protein n=1 Tax=unclassified Conexibacter TaxID=2627773 RepID=UPI00271DB5C9|nr:MULTISPECIES: hypothetical protein [unclassified Conexibacter]MDO8189076.1 hypothetical protein [Conexibacter sp. CPCC 205706]MDO8201877.1 hypothetical protein [Conexibacter sp. CPCC 205762]MDR9372510.1 hypothetical protein [Conexibacter sp. JD483]
MPVKFPTRTVAVIAATAAAGLSGAVIAGAATSGSASSGASTQQRTHDGRGPGGPGGHRHGPHADLTQVSAALGVSEAKLRAALDAARPDRGARDGFAAAIAAQLGASSADVQSVLDANRPDRGDDATGDRDGDGPRGDHRDGARPDDSALAAALAKKLSITQAKAQAALDAVHTAHDADSGDRAGRDGDRSDFYAAVAKALGKDAAAVKQAFEANQP